MDRGALKPPTVGGAHHSPKKRGGGSGSGDNLSGTGKGEIDKTRSGDDETHGVKKLPPRISNLDLEQGPVTRVASSRNSEPSVIERGLLTRDTYPSDWMERLKVFFAIAMTVVKVKVAKVAKVKVAKVKDESSTQNSEPNGLERAPESHTGGTTGPIDDGWKKLGKVFLAMSGQAVVSLMTYYTQNGNSSSYLAKTKCASYFVKAAIAVGFIATLIAVFLLSKKKGAADIFQKIGIIATVCAFIVALGTSFIPG